MENFWTETVGWVGNIVFVASYVLVSSGKIRGDGKAFNFMDLGGAILYGVYATLKTAYPILILEFFWGGIAIIALWRVYRSK